MLLARLINCQVEVFRSAQSITILLSVWSALKGRQKGGGCYEVNDRICGNGCVLSVDSVHVLTKDSAVTGAQLCQYSSCIPWQCLFGCSNGRRSVIKQFDELLSMAVLTASWWMLLNGSSGRYCWMLRLNRSIIWRSVAELMVGMLW